MKVPEAAARLYSRVWVCRKCKSKQKAEGALARSGKLICRKCNNKSFRVKKKEKKVKA